MAVDDIYTKALLHMDGANASTTFIDESGKTWTVTGTAKISTAQSKFGGASGSFIGNGNYISTPDSSDWDFPGDFTVDGWAYTTAHPADVKIQPLAGNCEVNAGSDGWMLGYLRLGAFLGLTFRAMYSGGWGIAMDYAVSLTLNQWNHWAVVRNGTRIDIYLNGISGLNATEADSITGTRSMFIGGNENSITVPSGYIDEVRISKGIARWTSNFTPPTQPYGSDLLRPIWFD